MRKSGSVARGDIEELGIGHDSDMLVRARLRRADIAAARSVKARRRRASIASRAMPVAIARTSGGAPAMLQRVPIEPGARRRRDIVAALQILGGERGRRRGDLMPAGFDRAGAHSNSVRSSAAR